MRLSTRIYRRSKFAPGTLTYIVSGSCFFRLAKINAQLHRVNKERDALVKQRRDAVLLDVKTRCRNFAVEFIACLPREIRDMVYAEVWHQPFDRSHLQPHMSLNVEQKKAWWEKRLARIKFCNSPWLYPCNEKPCQCYLLSDLPVWVFPQYVGYQVATEAAQSYYRVKYMVVEADQLPGLEAFLMHDHLHLNVKPAHHIRHLELQIQATETNELGYMNIEDFAKLERYLRPLLNIRLKEGFHLKLCLYGEDYTPVDALEALAFVVVAFKNAGAIVKIHSDFNNMIDDDLSDFYGMPVDEWMAKRQAMRDESHWAYSDSSNTDSDVSEDTSGS